MAGSVALPNRSNAENRHVPRGSAPTQPIGGQALAECVNNFQLKHNASAAESQRS
jgi:hypothetical protein